MHGLIPSALVIEVCNEPVGPLKHQYMLNDQEHCFIVSFIKLMTKTVQCLFALSVLDHTTFQALFSSLTSVQYKM